MPVVEWFYFLLVYFKCALWVDCKEAEWVKNSYSLLTQVIKQLVVKVVSLPRKLIEISLFTVLRFQSNVCSSTSVLGWEILSFVQYSKSFLILYLLLDFQKLFKGWRKIKKRNLFSQKFMILKSQMLFLWKIRESVYVKN